MSMGLLAQYVVIGLIVVCCMVVMFRKLAPQLSSRCLATLSMRLNQPGHAAWLRAIGQRLQPKQAAGSCGDGCSTCGSCGPKPPAALQAAAMPLEFRPRAK